MFTKRQAREFINQMEKFAKRSKHITFTYKRYFEFYRMDVHVTKPSGKVYKEMMKYLTKVFEYHECIDPRGEYQSEWFRTYNIFDIEVEDIDNLYDVEMSVAYWPMVR
jgi:hypothetical protein